MSKQKPISGKLLGSTYKRSKKKYKSQDQALEDVLKRNIDENAKNLVASETDKYFVFEAKTKF